MILNIKSFNTDLRIDSATPRRRIYLMRLIVGVSQSELANAAGISTRTLQRVEYGESPLTIDLVFAAANLFKVEPGLFFSTKVPPITFQTLQDRLSEPPSMPDHLYPELVNKLKAAHKALLSSDQFVPMIRYNLRSLDLNGAAQSQFGLTKSSYQWLDLIPKETLVVKFDTLTQVNGKIYLSHTHFPIENSLVDSINISFIYKKHSDALHIISAPVDASAYCEKFHVDMARVQKELALYLGHQIDVLPIIS